MHGFGLEREQDLDFQGVYRLPAGGGALQLLVDDFVQPNGLCFGSGESQLYVNDTTLDLPLQRPDEDRWQPARLDDLEIQRLLEPVVRVELVVERVDLAIPGGAVEADRLRQRVVCLEPDPLRTRIRRAALQRTE